MELIPICGRGLKGGLVIFKLADQKAIQLKEFITDYNQASWLGYISNDEDKVNHGQWTVRMAVERNYKAFTQQSHKKEFSEYPKVLFYYKTKPEFHHSL